MSVFGDEISNIDSVYIKCTQNMVVDFQCRDHSYPIAPALSWSNQNIDLFDFDFEIMCS